MDVMENPSPVPVRRQKYRRLHLYYMIPALVIGSVGSCGPGFEVCQIAGMSPANISTGRWGVGGLGGGGGGGLPQTCDCIGNKARSSG